MSQPWLPGGATVTDTRTARWNTATTDNPPSGIKVWNGAFWELKPVREWTGTAWVTKPLKFWDGTAWRLSTY